MATETKRIQVRRGLAADLPALAAGEPGFTTDTREMYVGSSVGNIRVVGDYITPGQYGAVGDGVTDDTAAIQAAIDAAGAGSVIALGNKTYIASTLVCKSDVYFLSMNSTVKIKANTAANASLFNFANVARAGILGHLTIDGNKANQINTDATGQIGVTVQAGSTDCQFDRIYIKNCSKDGFYAGGSSTVTDTFINSLVVAGAIRNGVSLTDVDGFVANSIIISGTTGSSPGYGLDVERNAADDMMRDIWIGYLEVSSCNVHGVSIASGTLATSAGQDGVTIEKLISHDNTDAGLAIYGMNNVRLPAVDIYSNLYGINIPRDVRHIRIGGRVHTNGVRGINAVMSGQTKASRFIDMRELAVYNNSQSSANAYDGVYISSDSGSYVISNVSLERADLYDDQGTHTQRYGLVIGANVGAINCNGIRFSGNASGDYLDSSAAYYDILPSVFAATAQLGALQTGGGPTFSGFNIVGGTGTTKVFSHQADALADDGTVVLPDATSGMVLVSCNAEAGMWLVQADGTCTKISGSTNTAAADTDGNLCVYDSGTGATVKNRLGATGEIRIVYFYN